MCNKLNKLFKLVCGPPQNASLAYQWIMAHMLKNPVLTYVVGTILNSKSFHIHLSCREMWQLSLTGHVGLLCNT